MNGAAALDILICPTCGQPPPMRGFIDHGLPGLRVDGRAIRLTPCEYVIAEELDLQAPDFVRSDRLIADLYGAYEPEWADGNLRNFIFQIRKKITGTPLRIRTVLAFGGNGYALEYGVAAV